MSYFTGQYGLAKAEKHAAAAVHSAAVIRAMENVTEASSTPEFSVLELVERSSLLLVLGSQIILASLHIFA